LSHKIAPEIYGIYGAMILDGKIDLDVPAEKAWDFLIDISKFSTCLPGIDEVKQIDNKTFDGVISATVGPIPLYVSLDDLESQPPADGGAHRGKDSVTQHGQRDMTVELRRVSGKPS
jgi:hypothetical protein